MSMRALAIVIVSAVASLPGASFGSAAADQARAALRTKQFATAVATLEAAASHGDGAAQYLLGLTYASGVGVTASDTEARRWLAAAASSRAPEASDASYALAGLLARGSPAERAEALTWLTRAARAGHPQAQRLLAANALPLDRALPDAHDARRCRELLFWAARHDNAAAVQAFVPLAGINAVDDFGRSALEEAAAAGAPHALAQLLAAGADAHHADASGATALMLASATDSEAALRALLGVSELEAHDHTGHTALAYAARSGRSAQVSALLGAGANVNAVDAAGWTPLDAAHRGDFDGVARALREAHGTGRLSAAAVSEGQGIDPLRPGEMYRGWPPLAIAASRNDATLVSQLTAAGAPVDALTPQGDTALLTALKSNAPAVIAPLLTAHADPLRADGRGRSALGIAVESGAPELINALLEHGVPAEAHAAHEEPPLLRAIRAGQRAAAERLLAAGARPDEPAADGTTALMLAGESMPELLEPLLKAGADVHRRDRSGHDALWYAAAHGSSEAVARLIAAGAPVRDAEGDSALFAAVRADSVPVLRRLLGAGAAANVTRTDGDTPLMAAAARGQLEAVRALVQAGAAVDRQNPLGDTALIIAARAGQLPVCRALIEAGANPRLRNSARADALDTVRRLQLGDIERLLTAAR